MIEETHKPTRGFPWIRAGIGLVLVIVIAATILYLRSDGFRERVRREVVAELENATGGRVELKKFSWSFLRLQFDIDDLTIHGLEEPGEAPYAHFDHAHVDVKIISWLRRELALRELDVEHPVVHLIVYPDGSTNQPAPKARGSGGGSGNASLFALRMDRLRVSDGLLLLNDRQIALNLNADKVTASMIHRQHPEPNYSGQIQAGRVELRYVGLLDNGACVAEAASRFTAAPAMQPRGCDTTIVSQAGVKFTLHKNDVEINSAHWSSGKSEMEASGKITDFRHPHIEAKYKGRVELETVGLLFGQTELRDGIVDLNGSFRYISSEDFFSSGQLTLKDGAYSASGFRVSGVDANSDYSVDVDRIALTNLRGRALGGGFSGGVSLLHWAKIAPKSRMSVGRREKPQFKPQEGSVQITLSGIQLTQGLRALLPPKNPFNQLRIASNAQGKLGIRWTGSPTSSEIAIDLSTQAPAAVSSSELPLTGSVQATYHAREDRVDVAGLNLAGRATRMNATGAIGTQAQLRVSLNTTDFSELAPVMRALGSAEGPLPAIVHGQASFNGTVTGKFAAPTLIGHLQATDFDTVLSGIIHFGNDVPQKANNRPARRIHWDSLVADITYSPTTASARNVVVKRGRAQITGSENAGLIDGQLEPTSPLQVQMALHNTDFADLQQILDTSYPVTGTFNGHVTLNGTRENLNASGHLQLAGGAICQEPYHSLTADVQFRGDEVALRNVSLLQDGGRMSGGATYSFDAEQFSFNLTGNNFDLAHISRLQGRKISVGGHAEFTAYGSGTLSQPSINARVSVSRLIFNGEPAGDLVATGTTHGSDLHVEAHTNTQLASANLNGDVQMRGDFPAEAHLDLVKLNFDPLLRVYLPASVTGHSSLSGKFLLRGPLKHPRQIVITADVDQFAADIQDVKLHNEGPLRFTIGNQIATVQQLHIVGTDTDITGTGKVELAGAGHVDLHGNGHVNLAIVHSLNRGISSSGQMTFTVNAIGKLDDPSLSGNMQIANGTFALSDLPNGLSQINGTLSFDTNRLRVQKLTAKTGGGDLVLGGYITYSNGVFFDLTATGRDVRIRYPEGVSSQATADLRLVGTLQNSVLSGDVTVTKFGLTPQFDLAAYVQRAKQPPTPPNPNSLVDNVRLDVHIVSTPELRLETSLARVSGDVDIHLRGTAARPSVLGRVSIAEGDITFNSTTYHLERGDIVFANPVRIEPVVNVEASARVRDYDITLGFHGTPEKLNITYRSEPPLPSADIIALLAFGRTRQESEIQAEQGSQAASQQSFAQTASNAILGEALNSAVSSRVQKLFGISRIKIDPNLGGTEDNPNARLTIEQQVSKDVTVTYLTNLGQYPEEVLQVEYNINKNISVVAVRDYTGVLAIDFRIRQRKR